MISMIGYLFNVYKNFDSNAYVNENFPHKKLKSVASKFIRDQRLCSSPPSWGHSHLLAHYYTRTLIAMQKGRRLGKYIMKTINIGAAVSWPQPPVIHRYVCLYLYIYILSCMCAYIIFLYKKKNA